MQGPPDGLPSYRLLTGVDDAEFCRRVSAALELGYELHGWPAATFDGRNVIVAQALIWPGRSAPRTRKTAVRSRTARRTATANRGKR
jgi:hypothetical protein